VLRDEAEHQKKLEAATEEERKRESTARLETLKGKQNDDVQQLRHVNFFEAEEKREQDRLLQTHRSSPDSQAIVPVFLEKTKTEKRRPFYLRDNPFEKDEVSVREMKRKAQMDPMHSFQRHADDSKSKQVTSLALVVREMPSKRSDSSSDDDSKRKKKRRRKEKRRKSHKRDKKRHRSENKTTSDSLEELRQRRLERERKEKERTVHLIGDRPRKYQDQYNPDLSRR